METEGRLAAAGSDEAPGGADRRRRRMGCGTGCLLAPLGLILCAALFGLWWFSRLAEERRRLAAHVAELVGAHQAARPEVPADQDAAPLYWSAVALYVVPTDENIKTNKPEAAAPGAVEKHLADNAAYLEALKKALARPQCSAQADVSAGFGATFALTQNLRQAARFLAMAAQAEARAGRPGQALELVGMILRVGRDVGTDGTVIGHMVCGTCEGIAAGALEKVLEASEPSGDQLRRTIEALDAHRRARRSLAEVFGTEKVRGLVTLEQLAAGTMSLGRLTGAGGPGPAAAERAWRASGGPFRDARVYERMMDDAVRAADRPLPGATAELERLDRDMEKQMAGRFPWSTLGLFSPGLGRIMVSEQRGLARLELMRLAVGCRLLRLETGARPAKLEDLASRLPELFPSLPADPFTGGPFGYARSGQGFKVWSAGENGRDDGGTSRPPNSGGQGKWDIVLEVTR